MKFLAALSIALATASSVAAQAVGGDFSEQVLSALRSNGLTSLADAVAANPAVVVALQSPGNKTVLAPTNQALESAGDLPEGDALVNLLSYHVLNGSYTNDRIDDGPLLARTLLTSGVELPGNASQVVILDSQGDDDNERSFVKGNTANVTFANGTDGPVVGSIRVQPIETVLTPPGTLSSVLGEVEGASAAVEAFNGADLVTALSNTRGITIFVPNNAAFQAVQANISSAPQEAQLAVLRNHVINGTTIYSPQIDEDAGDNTVEDGLRQYSRATSASGQELRFVEEDDNVFVETEGARARIVRSDLLFANGVAHVIDGVLFNTNTNQTAADDAEEEGNNNAGGGSSGGNTGAGGGSGGGSGSSPDGALSGATASMTVASLCAAVIAGALTLA
ncbi:FAS1 domain-containing protein [Ceraceosorus guamensis]|uniref:FAS1 domain-containing protein n=1 Tax=Ceraceosorus guamensis TaxID=1522189 RepID=A0A316W5M1_9BASI|nr:FAS1 domain-containing protein [Ceraceosorus guamensis]PWN45149.1 FAS1 domain-containing protein [Ceraceosorus guamensis]